MSTPRESEHGGGIYGAMWTCCARWLKADRSPVTLPCPPDASAGVRRYAAGFSPDEAYRRYLRLSFLVSAAVITLGVLAIDVVLLFADPAVGVIVTILSLPLLAVYWLAGHFGVRFKFDTTRYAMNDRCLRIRRGLLITRETTITFENIQNLAVRRGFVERLFGIGRLVVETAGASGAAGSSGVAAGPSVGILAGIADLDGMRDLILVRAGSARGAGLGDEPDAMIGMGWRLTATHVEVLREIRDAVRTLPTDG